jgi:hypothetical protein
MDLPTPSKEQQIIINKFEEGYNLTVDSVAGSGKTTVLLHLIKFASLKKRRSLLVTYNKALQVDVSERCEKNALSKIAEIRTIHSACGRAYSTVSTGTVITKDDKAIMALKDVPIPKGSLLRGFDIVLVDEAQDLSEERMMFLRKISDGKQIVLVGDPRQNIYEYSGTTSEYFVNARLYFPSDREWCETEMITSFRLTKNTAKFVDRHVMGPNVGKKVRIIGGNTKDVNKKVRIYAFNHPNLARISNRIFKLIDTYGVKEVAIISNTIVKNGKSRPNPASPLGKIVGTLAEKGITPAFVFGEAPKSSNGSFEAGKLLVSTWCSMKGREKNAVVVLGADEGYFRFYAKDWQDPQNVPNSVYVAMTRARKEMVVLVDIDSGPLRTFDMNIIEEMCEVKGKLKKKSIDPMDRYTETNEMCVTDALKHRRVRDVVNLLQMIEETEEKEYKNVRIGKRYIIPFVSKTANGGREMLSHVGSYYGTVIPELAEYELTGFCKSRLYHIWDFILSFIRKNLEKRSKKRTVASDYTVVLQATNPTIIKAFGVEMIQLRKKLLDLDFDEEYEESENFLVDIMLPSLLHYVDKKDKRREEIIFQIIQSMKEEISARSLMEIACFTDAYRYLYLASIFSDMEWVDVDFIVECCDNLKEYVKSASSEIGKFEVPVKCELTHPYLKNLKTVRKSTDDRVRAKVETETFDSEDVEYFDSLGLTIAESEIITRDPFKLSNKRVKLTGRVDYVDGNGDYHEFKIATDDKENFSIQLGSYVAMGQKEMGYVYNISTGKRHTYRIVDGDRFLRHIARGTINWENLGYYEEGKRAPSIKYAKMPA